MCRDNFELKFGHLPHIYYMTKKEDEVKKTSEETTSAENAEDTTQGREKKEHVMDRILNDSANPPSIDDVIEGTVIGIEKQAVYIDIPPFGTGIIYGREYINARDIIKKIN